MDATPPHAPVAPGAVPIVPPGCCPVPPRDYGTAAWERDLAPLLDAFTDRHARAQRLAAGDPDEHPLGPSGRKLWRMREGELFPPSWLEDPRTQADACLWRHADEAELRALGYCRSCGRAVALEQVGRCVYTTCGHYRAQGNLRPMRAYLDALRPTIAPERAEALLRMFAPLALAGAYPGADR